MIRQMIQDIELGSASPFGWGPTCNPEYDTVSGIGTTTLPEYDNAAGINRSKPTRKPGMSDLTDNHADIEAGNRQLSPEPTIPHSARSATPAPCPRTGSGAAGAQR